jgi:hypothetical protein
VLGPGAQRPKPLRVNVTGGRRRTADHTPTPPPSPDLHSRVRREVHMQLTLAEQQCPGAQEESERLAAEAQSGSGPHSADTGCSVM